MAGSSVRKEWKQQLHDRLAVQAATIDPGPAGLSIALRTGPGRNWASLCKPLTGAFGPVLGEDPTRPFHPHDDRIVSLALHHTTGTSIARASADARPWRRTEHDVSASDEPGHPHRSIFQTLRTVTEGVVMPRTRVHNLNISLVVLC